MKATNTPQGVELDSEANSLLALITHCEEHRIFWIVTHQHQGYRLSVYGANYPLVEGIGVTFEEALADLQRRTIEGAPKA